MHLLLALWAINIFSNSANAWLGDPNTIMSADNPYLARAKKEAGDKDIAFWTCWGYAAPESLYRGNSTYLNTAKTQLNTLINDAIAANERIWRTYEALECVYMLSRYPGYTASISDITNWLGRLEYYIDWAYEDMTEGVTWEQYAPNAMSQYAATLKLASMLYSDKQHYAIVAQDLIEDMYQNFKLSSGALNYVDNSSPSALYHAFELTFIGRYYMLTHDFVAHDLIIHMAGYCHDMLRNGYGESSTAPHWKRYWSIGGPISPFDISAGLSKDPVARAVAASRISGGMARDFRFYAYTPMYFYDNTIPTGSLGSDLCRYNYNIGGPQIRKNNFQIMMPTMPRCETGIGASVASTTYNVWNGYMETANIPILKSSSSTANSTDGTLFVTWPESLQKKSSIVQGTWVVGADAFSPRKHFYGELTPPVADKWSVAQIWFGDKDGLSGWIMAKATAATSSFYGPRGYIKVNTSPSPSNSLNFTAGSLNYAIYGSNVGSVTSSGSSVWVNLTGLKGAYVSGDNYSYGLSCAYGASPYLVEYINQSNNDVVAVRITRSGKADIVMAYNNASTSQVLTNVNTVSTQIYRSLNNGEYAAEQGTVNPIIISPRETVVIVSLLAGDAQPPQFIGSGWVVQPHAIENTTISMQAEAVDNQSNVEYYFNCLTPGGHDSGWQSSGIYEDTGLNPETSYTYRVKVRDTSSNQNESVYTEEKSAFTGFLIPSPDPALWHVPPHISTSGSEVEDSAGSNHGFLTNGTIVQIADSAIQGSAQFDGIDDYIDIPDYYGVAAKTSRTCSAWVKTSQAGTILSWGDPATGNDWRFIIQASYGLVSQKGGPCIKVGAVGYSAGIADVRDNQWHHVAVVLPSVATPYTTHINYYVDGVKKTLIASPAAINTATGHNVKIGTYNNADYFNGLIDDVRIYNRSLSDAEIATLAAKGIVSSTGLVAHWNLDEMIGGEEIVSMTAASGSQVQYYFESQTENGIDSGWIDEPAFAFNSILPGDKFTYRVKLRSTQSLFETQWSDPKSCYVSPEADFDEDGDVDLDDLFEFTEKWLDTNPSPQNLDGQGNVDMVDFSLFSKSWRWNTNELYLD